MTNFIQMVPVNTSPTQHWSTGAANPLAMLNATQATAMPPTPTPGTTQPAPTKQGTRSSSRKAPTSRHLPPGSCYLPNALPYRRRVQGTYNTSIRADEQVKGFRNGRSLAVHSWVDPEAEWAACCLRWHGTTCPNVRPPMTMATRVHLNPALRREPPEQWAVKRLANFFPSRSVVRIIARTELDLIPPAPREAAFAAVVANHFCDIHIFGSPDEDLLAAWLKK
ncbi:hypothetical protein K438DRAFT_1770718 [Mycena galopus ATCC 62051]|nr:hypothetical protein K438DRAFT_1770718 [Mycena galopus ATCC 62051]